MSTPKLTKSRCKRGQKTTSTNNSFTSSPKLQVSKRAKSSGKQKRISTYGASTRPCSRNKSVKDEVRNDENMVSVDDSFFLEYEKQKSFDFGSSDVEEDLLKVEIPGSTSRLGRTEKQVVLKEFDLDPTFGPCRGITRSARVQRALKFNLNLPPQLTLILRDGEENEFQKCIWDRKFYH